MRSSRLGLGVLAAWIVGQALWLQQGYQLEFLGKSTFVPGLWGASLVFFGVNCWILGIVVSDIAGGKEGTVVLEETGEAETSVEAVEGEPGPAVVTTPRKVEEVGRRHDAANERTKATLRFVRNKSQG